MGQEEGREKVQTISRDEFSPSPKGNGNADVAPGAPAEAYDPLVPPRVAIEPSDVPCQLLLPSFDGEC
jgi:hypothetical protein